MYNAFKFKLIELWNRVLHSLMIRDARTAPSSSTPQPSYEELSSTLSAIPDLMFELDEYGRHWDVRVLRPELLVAPAEELLGHTVTEIMPEEAATTVMQALEEAKQNGYSHGNHILLPTPLGELWFEVSIARKKVSNQNNTEQEGSRFIVLSRDINDLKSAYLQAEKLAYHDELTELPNRYALKNGLMEKISSKHKKEYYCALLFLDLDNFKQVNDQQGHHAGDQILKTVAQRLRNSVRDDDMVIRWGGDEFIILISELSANQDNAQQKAAVICKQIADKIGQPYQLNKGKFTCEISIGVNLFNDPESDIETLIEQADAAMYKAKQAKKGYEFYQS